MIFPYCIIMYEIFNKKVFLEKIQQFSGLGSQSRFRSRMFLTPWSRSRLKKNRSRSRLRKKIPGAGAAKKLSGSSARVVVMIDFDTDPTSSNVDIYYGKRGSCYLLLIVLQGYSLKSTEMFKKAGSY